MAGASHVKNIVVVGATGNLGTVIVKALAEADRFNITAASRNPPGTPFPDSVGVKIGDYSTPSFLSELFSGQDAAIFTLHHSQVPELEITMIEAAAEAGVKWILPVEFSGDNGNERLEKAIPVYAVKRPPRERVEELAKSHEGLKWIGVVTNSWFDYNMRFSGFKIDVKNKTALLLDRGTAKFNTTNVATVGLAVARLFSLPVTADSGASLSDFGDRFVYISSFWISQREILDAVQEVTHTTDADWTISHVDGKAWIAEGWAKLAKGDFTGMGNIINGNLMTEGLGGDYSARGVSNSVLGLPEENLVDTLRALISE